MIGCTVRQRAEHSHRKVQQQLGILLLIFRIHTFWKAWVNRNKCRILASDTDSFSINFALVFSAGTETAIIWRIEDDCVPARRACDSSRVCDHNIRVNLWKTKQMKKENTYAQKATNDLGKYYWKYLQTGCMCCACAYLFCPTNVC